MSLSGVHEETPAGSGIPTVRVTSVSYPYVQSATAENTGKTIQIDATKFNPRGTLTFNNKVYLLENIHVHTPSEHRLFEEHFPLETHFVHRLSGEAQPASYLARDVAG